MANALDAIAWKTDYKSGMYIEGDNIIKWDESALGPKPDTATIQLWITEYDQWQDEQAAIEAAKIAKAQAKLDEILAKLPTWNAVKTEFGTLKDAIQAATTVAQLRNAVLDYINFDKKMGRILYLLARTDGDKDT
jgi:hypothetical protein